MLKQKLIIFLLLLWFFQGHIAAKEIETLHFPAQVSDTSQNVSPSPTQGINQTNDGATVTLNYRAIIKVQGDTGMSASERARIIEERLEEVLQKADKPPYVEIKTVDEIPVLESEGIYIISVTNNDASSNNTSVGILAAIWRDTIEKGLQNTMKERSKEYTKVALIYSLIAFIAGIALTIIVIFIAQKWLKQPGYFTTLIIWVGVVSYILWVFPVSRLLSRQVSENILQPVLTLFLIVLMVKILFKPIDIFVKHYFDTEEKLKGQELRRDARTRHRLTMQRMVISIFVKAAMIIFSVLLFLKSLNIDLATGLAGAGIIGVGLGLVLQDLLKDFFSGIFIVIEDQFAIGDVIRIGDSAGTVEYFNLRVTRLRDMEGGLITIPNSVIRTVENFSSTWSQIDCTLTVSYDTDLKKAMDIMIDIAMTLREECSEKILDKPVMLGVDALSDLGVKLRMLVKTAPSEQWQLKRELLLRIKSRFEKEGIKFALPQPGVWIKKEDSTTK